MNPVIRPYRSISAASAAMLLAALPMAPAMAAAISTNSAAFKASLSSYYEDTFNTLTPTNGTTVPPLTGYSASHSGFEYSISTTGGSGLLWVTDTSSGGPANPAVGAYSDADNLTISFSGTNVQAVGGNFFFWTSGYPFYSNEISLRLSDNTTHVFTPTSMIDTFVGFSVDSSTYITSLTFDRAGSGSYLYAALDNLVVGAVPASSPSPPSVPEPSSLCLLGIGAFCLWTIAKSAQKAGLSTAVLPG